MRNRFHAHRGQTLVIVALSILVLLGFVALGIDGGSALLQRRHMQDGADAAALGAIRLMEGNIAVTCSPAPCHPTYADITNGALRARILQLVNANHGDTTGPAGYPAPLIEYHFMAGAPNCPNPAQACYLPATVASYPDAYAPPPFMDGIRVTAAVSNPTTFARAINIQNIGVSAWAAARVFASCNTVQGEDKTLPMLRFGPSHPLFSRTERQQPL